MFQKPEKTKNTKGFVKLTSLLRVSGQLILVLFLISLFVRGMSAYEAHVINVTARICTYVETRTIGFWKNHVDIILENSLLPQSMGHHYTPPDPPDEKIYLPRVGEIFEKANADEMIDMLRAQLLAMKFNVDYFLGTGDFENDGMTIYGIIEIADDLLRDPDSTREEMEQVKNLLDYLNNQHQLTHCLGEEEGFSFFGMDEGFLTQLINSVSLIEITIEPPTECEAEALIFCTTGQLGLCSTGIQICSQEGFWSECVQERQAISEICDDGLDNNCNGYIDCEDGFCSDDEACQLDFVPELKLIPESYCGDNNLDEGEECDDGNNEDGDGCSFDCLIETPEPITECETDAQQVCDTNLLGVCTAGTQTCDSEGFWGECVQDNLSIAEVCDNQLDDDCDGLSDCEDDDCTEDSACQPELYCGDGAIEGEEQCDTGQDNGLECVPEYGSVCSYCSTDCQAIELAGAYCGDGNLDEAEECDDGNNDDEDGCSAVCAIEQESESEEE